MNVYDFKTKQTSLGIVKSVLGNNTYSVDCGFGPLHVSGDALSRSTLTYQEGSQQGLTAQDDQYPLQDDHTGQRDSDVVVESDSSDDDDDNFYGGVLPAPAAAPRRRRVRDLGLGPLMPTRLRQRR